MVTAIEITVMLNHLSLQKESLSHELSLGIITADDARQELSMISKKERKLREQYVNSHHIKQDGTLRSISYHNPTEKNPKGYYITKLANGCKVKATTYDGLMEKLFTVYTNGMNDFSVKAVFEAALTEKKLTENPKEGTLKKNRADYNRYISESFAKKDIRKITDIDVKKYLQEWVNETHPKQKSYLSCKGILNLIFEYATRHKIIGENPVSFVKNRTYMKSCDTRKPKPEEKILSPDEIASLEKEIRHRMTLPKWGPYYPNGFAALFSIETGVRVGELCALKWEDIHENYIHIHAQQLSRQRKDKTKEYYYDYCTKNEKGDSQDGREFPRTKKITALLKEIWDLQKELGIESEFIFCNPDGDWIKKDAYITFLKRICRSLGFQVTNNHALRMSLNSNVLIPKGVSVADRAAMLGHSIETNLKNYSFARKGYLEDVKNLLDEEEYVETPGNPSKVIQFKQKHTSEALISQRF